MEEFPWAFGSFFIAVKVSPVLYGYAILYFVFNIAENAFLSKGDNKSNNYIAVGQAGFFGQSPLSYSAGIILFL